MNFILWFRLDKWKQIVLFIGAVVKVPQSAKMNIKDVVEFTDLRNGAQKLPFTIRALWGIYTSWVSSIITYFYLVINKYLILIV